MRRSIGWSGWAACLLLAAGLVLGPLASRRAHAQGGQKWALVVGVDRYQHEQQIHPLRDAGNDARAVKQALVEAAGFPAANVYLMTSQSGSPPTSDNVLARLASLQALVQPGDTFVFFFSGHGVEKGDQRWLLTANTNPAAPFTLDGTSLEVSKIREIIQSLKASRILELVDACADNPWGAKKGIANARSTAGMARDLTITASRSGGDLEAAVTILSCKEGQRSFEGCQGHGYFTYYLVAGLRGAARKDGVVSVPSLVSYLKRTVPRAVMSGESGQRQDPWVKADGASAFDWVLSAGKSAPGPVALSIPSTDAAGQQEQATADALRKEKAEVAALRKQQAEAAELRRAQAEAAALKRQQAEAEVAALRKKRADEEALRKAQAEAAALKGQQSEATASDAPPTEVAMAQGIAGMRYLGTNTEGYRQFQNEKDGSVGIVIPSGAFQMGDSDQSDNPPRSVALPAYWIGKYPVTNAQYRRFVNATGHQSAGDWQQYASEWGDQAPVVEVSWNDAVAYCEWAGLRLPTEEEWEKAARGTDGRKYPWGNDWDASRCRNSVGSNNSSGAAPVGSYPSGASPYGCLDMAGNVWQWTASWYDSSQQQRVLRGGSWNFTTAVHFRAAYRLDNSPGSHNNYGGLRVARTL